MPCTDRETPRAIAIVGLIALLLTAVGHVVLGIVLKMSGYPIDTTVRWSPLSIQLRDQGPWLLVVVFLWLLYAIACWRLDRGLFSEWLAALVGIVLSLVIAGLYSVAIGHPYTRPMLISVAPRSDNPTTPATYSEHATPRPASR